MNVVITGGTGYLGSHIVRAMVKRGWHVTVITLPSSGLGFLTGLQECVRLVSTERLAQAFDTAEPVDIVVHAATCYGRNGESAADMLDANVRFPLQVLRCAMEHGVGLFCNTDTILSRHTDSYGLSKKQFLEWLQFSAGNHSIRGANLVLDQFYGPGQSGDRFVVWLVRKCLAGVDIPLTAGTQKRRFLYIDDLVDGYMTALQYAIDHQTQFVEFQIASPRPIAIREFVEKVHAMSNSRSVLRFGAVPQRSHEPIESVMDLSSTLALGWEEHVTLECGLAAVIEYEKGLLH